MSAPLKERFAPVPGHSLTERAALSALVVAALGRLAEAQDIALSGPGAGDAVVRARLEEAEAALGTLLLYLEGCLRYGP